MMNPGLFLVILIILALLQVSLLPIPFGLLAILFWFMRVGEKHLPLHIGIFSVCLGISANIPIWLVLAATSIGFYAFVGAKYFLPSRLEVHIGLAIISIIIWEISMLGLNRWIDL
jgi:hypothetical protein